MTVYLSNWSSHRTVGAHGPGHKYTIMAFPRDWERGEGAVPTLVPDADTLRRFRARADSYESYRAFYLRRFTPMALTYGFTPGGLLARATDGGTAPVVADGDTLACACAVGVARAGRCHRTWAAAGLTLAGWSVVLDGKPLTHDEARSIFRGDWGVEPQAPTVPLSPPLVTE